MDVKHTVGRRKTAVARIYLKKGTGKIVINKKSLENYFPSADHQYKVNQPLTLTEQKSKFDIVVNVYGGGIKGQAEAIRLAISKALLEVDPEYRAILKPEGLLTRDSRMVERKKFGRKKARKKYQFSKR